MPRSCHIVILGTILLSLSGVVDAETPERIAKKFSKVIEGKIADHREHRWHIDKLRAEERKQSCQRRFRRRRMKAQ